MKSQKGMTTLLITSMLLIVALLFSLASYKNLFYQIKRTQNEVVARQSHWLSEGGLECGFTIISNEQDATADISNCKIMTDYKLDELILSGPNPYLLTSVSSNRKVFKTLEVKGGESSGVVKSSADLYFNGDYRFFPDPGNEVDSNKWECVLLRYLNNIFIHNNSAAGIAGVSGIGSNDLNYHNSPYDDFYSAPTDVHTCQTTALSVTDSYRTPVQTQLQSNFNADIIDESSMDLFKETFGVSSSEWITIRDGGIFTPITVTNPSQCASDIESVLTIDQRYVWVTGNCSIESGTGFNDLKTKTDSVGGAFILVHKGLLSFGGASELNAVVYHFNDGYSPNKTSGNDWSSLSIGTTVLSDSMYVPTEGSVIPTTMKNNVVFYMYGSFVPSGGFILDAEDKVSYFNSSINMSFDGELISELLTPFAKPKWVQGSWNDL
ncbi:hypothetical protein [Photobacterium angustum]|uniref:hypothetical protein n=1 Tax=Photobacterium angustum TaxID=661 RepID=UPI0005DAF61E|nr:hypothetical protein [Photobacterium angustum]KJG17338.1 hypothetical protein UA33_10430 [Photobacterium angustum]KJG23722.1 hypothetical protein UA39_10975 [Photobacterium angustum]KJG30843.1 hypothetical protein UA36_11995 [Photobacterium angustum]PSW94211.1 hypothetical protein C0W79_15485 [Photobacterium angustum]PSX02797.1 hypothetical protein C0W87_08390 [Photobacterium angustum]